MKANDRNKKIVAICAVLLVVLLVLFATQINKMGVVVTPFFDEYGLPTILFDLCAVLFGVILIVMGNNIDKNNTSLRKLCRVIGILEIVCSVIYFVMVQILLASIK